MPRSRITKKPPRSRMPVLYDVRIELRDVMPPIWRRVAVWSVTSLHDFHRVIQELFGWQDYHLYQFQTGKRSFEAPDKESTSEDSTKVSLAGLALKPGDSFAYVYDFGDDWTLDITILGTPMIDSEACYPRCLDGRRAGPPDDAGGPHGYGELLKILASPKHPAFKDRREWIGEHFDPEVFDLRATNRILMLAFPTGAV